MRDALCSEGAMAPPARPPAVLCVMLSSPPRPQSPSGGRYSSGSASASVSVTSGLVGGGGGGARGARPYRSSSAATRPRSLLAVLPEYLRRLTDLKQMDFEFACSQMVNLCRAPSAAYAREHTHAHP